MSMMQKRFDLKLDDTLYEWLREKSHKFNISMAEMTRRILYVERQMDLSPSKDQFINLTKKDDEKI